MSTTLTEIPVATRALPAAASTRWDALDVLRGVTIILMLLFGVVDMGRALYTANNLVSAAREGARFRARKARA